MEKLYKVVEVANLLSVTKQTIYNWINEGKISIVRINGNPRIKESELKNLMKGD